MNNSYSFSETIHNGFDLIKTKLIFPKARLIRSPFYIRGKKAMIYGEGLTIGHACRFDLNVKKREPTLIIGKNCQFGDNTHIVAMNHVEIGDNCLLASKIFISDTNHGDYSGKDPLSSPEIAPKERPLYHFPVKIGKNVWIGENVCILAGVTIGDGCIIGANSVVNKSVKSCEVVCGAPAKMIKNIKNS